MDDKVVDFTPMSSNPAAEKPEEPRLEVITDDSSAPKMTPSQIRAMHLSRIRLSHSEKDKNKKAAPKDTKKSSFVVAPIPQSPKRKTSVLIQNTGFKLESKSKASLVDAKTEPKKLIESSPDQFKPAKPSNVSPIPQSVGKASTVYVSAPATQGSRVSAIVQPARPAQTVPAAVLINPTPKATTQPILLPSRPPQPPPATVTLGPSPKQTVQPLPISTLPSSLPASRNA